MRTWTNKRDWGLLFYLSRSRRGASRDMCGLVCLDPGGRRTWGPLAVGSPGTLTGPVPTAATAPSAPAQGSLYARIAGVLVSIGIWLAINALLCYCLLELPPLKKLPPVPLGVADILANFYLIPLARRTGMRCRRYIEGAHAGTASWPI